MTSLKKDPTYFLHGLDSSGSGTKGQFFARHHPHIVCPNFSGTLQERLNQLHELCKNESGLILIGSSYGGLMATCYSISWPRRIARLILLAPALNYDRYKPPSSPLDIPTTVLIGKKDNVTPACHVVPLAEATFSNCQITLVNDDHFLHESFSQLDWPALLSVSP